MPKSSKKSATKVDSTAAVVTKSAKKGKRDAEEIIEKEVVSSRKQKVVNGGVAQAVEKKKVETKTQKKIVKKQESSSSEDSSSESKGEKKVAPKKAARVSAKIPVKAPSSSDDSDEEEPKKPAVVAKNGALAAKKKVESSSESESDDSSDEEDAKPAKKPTAAAAKNGADVAPAKKVESSDDSSSEESDSDEDVKAAPAKKPVAAAKKPESDSSSEDESSSDEEPQKKKAKPSEKQAAKPAPKVESSDSDESSDEEPAKPQAAKKPAAKVEESSDTEESSDEEPAKKPSAKVEESSDSDEEPEKPAVKKQTVKKDGSSFEEESEESSEEEVEPKTAKKKDTDVEMVDASSAKKAFINKMSRVIIEILEAIQFVCTFSFWRMGVLWLFAVIISYLKLRVQSIFALKNYSYPRVAVSPLPPMASSSTSGETFGKRLPICIITGATSGLGAAAALALSKEGFFVILAGRSSHKLSKVMSDIRKKNEEAHLEGFKVDLSSFSSIMKFKNSIEKWLLDSNMHPSVQLLINNAGILAISSQLTTEGHDRMMGTNYIGPFTLTEVMLPLLKNSPVPSRVVNVSSFTHRNVSSFRPDKETVSGKRFSEFKNYPCAEIYEYSKLCVLLFSYELHRQLNLTNGSQKVSVMAVDPGAVKTYIMRELPSYISQAAFAALWFLGFLRSPRVGVSSTVDAALAPPEASGLYFFGGDGRTVDSSALSYNLKLSKQLWDTSCDIFQDSLRIYNRDSVCSEKVY